MLFFYYAGLFGPTAINTPNTRTLTIAAGLSRAVTLAPSQSRLISLVR